MVSMAAISLMTRDTSCSQKRPITFTEMLDLDTNHCAFHQSGQYSMVARFKAGGSVTMEGESDSSA